jgi:Ca2+-binding EF-hand superfamily protein
MNLDIISNRFLQKRIETSNNPLDIELRLQACVVMKRVRIEEFFIDFDKLRKGKVTKNQFMSILSMMNFKLTNEESLALSNKYRTDDDMFNYK